MNPQSKIAVGVVIKISGDSLSKLKKEFIDSGNTYFGFQYQFFVQWIYDKYSAASVYERATRDSNPDILTVHPNPENPLTTLFLIKYV